MFEHVEPVPEPVRDRQAGENDLDRDFNVPWEAHDQTLLSEMNDYKGLLLSSFFNREKFPNEIKGVNFGQSPGLDDLRVAKMRGNVKELIPNKP
jgi:hypothetical protein